MSSYRCPAVSLLEREAIEGLSPGNVRPLDDRFLVESVALRATDLTTTTDSRVIKEQWATLKSQGSAVNKILAVEVRAAPADASDTDSDDSDDDHSTRSSSSHAAPTTRSMDALTHGSATSPRGSVGRTRSGSAASGNPPRAWVGNAAVALRRRSRHSSSVSSLPSPNDASTAELSLTVATATEGASVGSASSRADTEQECLAALRALSTGVPFRWTRGELLGRGTSGDVYKAMRKDTGEMIALKSVDVLSTRSQALIVKEVEALKKLNHPHVVSKVSHAFAP